MKKILIVDDEHGIREVVKKYAVFNGFEIDETSDGFSAIEKVKNNKYDLVIMDVMMPELDGFTAVRRIREFSNIPVIMLSAKSEAYDIINAFEIGIDDYVTKPFSATELMLRVKAVLSRAGSQDVGDIFEAGKLKIDFKARIVYIDGERVNLSPKEYDLLSFFIKNNGVALSREKLLTEVWGYGYFGDDRTLDTHIKLLRKSLGACAPMIVTIRGLGYRFESDATECPEDEEQ